jgi:hypothetical protein
MKDSGMGWLAEWVRNYYAERGYAGEALEKAVQEALDSARDLTIKPVIFRVKVTEDAFHISPYNMRYVVETGLKAVEVDEKTKKSMREGLLNPILVKPAEEYGKWYVIAGVRRAAALLGDYAHIRIYVPKDPREEARLSLHENIVRRDLEDLGLRLAAIKAEELGVKEELYRLLDPKKVRWLEEARQPVEAVQVEPPYLPQTREEEDRPRKRAQVTKPTAQQVAGADANGRVTQEALAWESGDHGMVWTCPSCGRPLRCAECGAPVH